MQLQQLRQHRRHADVTGRRDELSEYDENVHFAVTLNQHSSVDIKKMLISKSQDFTCCWRTMFLLLLYVFASHLKASLAVIIIPPAWSLDSCSGL